MQALNTFLSADSLPVGTALSRGAVRRPFALSILMLVVLTGTLAWQVTRLVRALDWLYHADQSIASLQTDEYTSAAPHARQVQEVKSSIRYIFALLVGIILVAATIIYILSRHQIQRSPGPLLHSRQYVPTPGSAVLKAFDLNTVLARSNHQLRERERELNEAQRLAHIGSWEWQIQGDQVTWSQEMYRIYQHDLMKPVPGFAEQQAFFTPKSWQVLKQSVHKTLLTGEPYSVELELAGVGKETRMILAQGEPERDGSGNIIRLRGTTQDITERKRLEDALSYQATHDALTGLPNRTLLMEALAMAVAESGKVGLLTGVLYLDADNFKDLNDSLGHHAGDCFLKRLAERISHCVSASDTIARIGGDEFVVVCGALTSVDELETIASCLLAEIRKPLTIDEMEFHGSISIGIAVAPRDGESAADLLRNADVAMYQAKRFSRDTHMFFAPEMIQKLRNRVDTEKHVAPGA